MGKPMPAYLIAAIIFIYFLCALLVVSLAIPTGYSPAATARITETVHAIWPAPPGPPAPPSAP